MAYLSIKHLHMLCAALSGGLFFLRGIWMLNESEMLHRRWVKIAPHIVDTLLLTSAVAMAIWSRQYPFAQNWLTAKLIALIIYIVLGSLALKYGNSKTARSCAFVAALATFVYIVSVAVTKQIFPFD